MGSLFSSPKVPRPLPSPKPVDETKAMLSAFQFAETERKMRASTGRRSTFLTTPNIFTGA